MSWATRETQTANLGDQRLNKRMTKLLDRALSQPTASIPVACRGWQETLAAYRFFDNPKVKAENVLAPHQAATRERMAEHDIVLCVQDTTELDYSGQSQTQGLGPLTYEAQRGLYLVRPAWARSCGWKSRRELITANEVKRNCMMVTDCGEEAWIEAASRWTRTGYKALPSRASGPKTAKLS